MRKRLLALLLALIMVVSMAPFAGANNVNDMPDVDEISDRYLTAAGVLVGLGVFEGNDAGEFAPQRTITRAEMTAVLFRLLNGSTAVPDGGTGTFDDVTPGGGSYWARGYIGWAQGEGLVMGVGGNRFEPGRAVTGVEASVMLLRALGYGVRGEFEGSGWAQRAINQALAAGLLRIVAGNETLANPARREVIAQIAYNTLNADRVVWDAAAQIYRQDPLQIHPIAVTVFGLRVIEDVMLPSAGTRMITAGGVTIDRRPTQQQHRISIAETGRVADVYYVDGTANAFTTSQLIYLAIVSTDVNLGRNTTRANALTAIENVGGRNIDRNSVAIFPDFTRSGGFINTTVGGGTDAANFGNQLNALFNLGGDGNTTWPATFVVFEGELRSVVWGTGAVRNVTINANDIAAGQVRLQGLGSIDTADIISSEIALNANFTGFANVFNVGVGTDREYIITEVESFTGTVYWVEQVNADRVNFGVQLARTPSRTFVTGTGTAVTDLNNALLQDASRLAELNDVESANALSQNIGRQFTFYINGTTGQIVAARGQADGAAPATRAVVLVESPVYMVVDGVVRPHARVISGFSEQIEIIRLNEGGLPANGDATMQVALLTDGGAQRGDIFWVNRDSLNDDVYTALITAEADGNTAINTSNTAANSLPAIAPNVPAELGTAAVQRIENNTRFIYLNASQANFVSNAANTANPRFSTQVGAHSGTIAVQPATPADYTNVTMTARDGQPNTVFVWASHDGDGVGEVFFVRGAGDRLANDAGWRFRAFNTDGTDAPNGGFITVTGTGANAANAVGFVGEGFYRVSANGVRLVPVTTQFDFATDGNDRRFAIGQVDMSATGVDSLRLDNIMTFTGIQPLVGDGSVSVDGVRIVGRNNATMTLQALSEMTGPVRVAVSMDAPASRNGIAVFVLPAGFGFTGPTDDLGWDTGTNVNNPTAITSLAPAITVDTANVITVAPIANVTINVNQTAGTVTLSPAATFFFDGAAILAVGTVITFTNNGTTFTTATVTASGASSVTITLSA